jgi:hypothetical protein
MEGGTQLNTHITLYHLDAIAHTFGIPVSYLFIPPDSTPEERTNWRCCWSPTNKQ